MAPPYLARWLIAGGVVAASASASGAAYRSLMPAADAVVGGARVGGQPVSAGDSPERVAELAGERLLSRQVELRYQGDSLGVVSAADLGATVDVAAIAREVRALGREGSLIARIDSALQARAGAVDVPVSLSLPVEPLAERLARYKEEHDRKPRPARLRFSDHTASAHEPGRYLDLYASAEAAAGALARGEASVELAPHLEDPLATTAAVLAIDTSSVVSRYETHFGYLGGQANRAQNVARAAEQLDGAALMPGEVLSFNDAVGARTLDNGFATAPEIYKGEMRDGVGGGTCQVSSTLHAAAFFGGLEIVRRSNHSRPSGYIAVGLDATVVYPIVDLELENPFDFPIVVRTHVERGVLRVELLGHDRPADVKLVSETVGVSPYTRKVEEASWLSEGKVKRKQKGIRGVSVRKTRSIHLRARSSSSPDRVEVTTDVYPPTTEIYVVSPGTDLEAALPPMPGDEATLAP